jgi:peptidyl-tRNA hydrolase
MYILIPDEVATGVATGKIMAHVAHNASIIVYEHKGEKRIEDWYLEMTKIVVRTPWTLDELREFVDNMRIRRLNKIPTAMITDNIMGTELCAAVGPMTEYEAENLKLNELKLY